MTDRELDEMLNQWQAPETPASLRQGVLAGIASAPRRRFGRPSWHAGKGLLFGTAGGVALFLLVITQVFPRLLGQVPPPAHIPWTVDSEFVRYADDGATSVEMYATSYEFNSNEVLLSRSVPGDPFMAALGRTLDVALPALSRLVTPFVVGADTLKKMKRVGTRGPAFITGCNAGCLVLDHYGFSRGNSCIAGKIAGRETILGHSTEAVRERWMDGRMTVWTAPDLGCFALRVTYEEPQPDGTFRVVRAKQAIKVTINP